MPSRRGMLRPSASSRRNSSFLPSPASMSRDVLSVSSSVQLPELPEARTVIRNEMRLTFQFSIEPLHMGSNVAMIASCCTYVNRNPRPPDNYSARLGHPPISGGCRPPGAAPAQHARSSWVRVNPFKLPTTDAAISPVRKSSRAIARRSSRVTASSPAIKSSME